jgi:uroporphyrinogen-III synthase
MLARTEFCAWRDAPLDKADRPLEGKRVVITRAPEQSNELRVALTAMGAEILLLPAVAFAPPEDWRLLDGQLRQLDTFDAILFLSQNAVRYLFQRCRELGIKCEFSATRGCFVGTVGEATKEAAIREGLHVDYVAKGQTAESLAQELRGSLAGRNVLLPRGDRGDDRLSKALLDAGARTTGVVAYRTVAPPTFDPAILRLIRRGDVDSIVFASPSAFHNLSGVIPVDELARLSSRVHFAAIGPTTASALRNSGVSVAIEATDSSSSGLAAAIAKHFESRQPAARRA